MIAPADQSDPPPQPQQQLIMAGTVACQQLLLLDHAGRPAVALTGGQGPSIQLLRPDGTASYLIMRDDAGQWLFPPAPPQQQQPKPDQEG